MGVETMALAAMAAATAYSTYNTVQQGRQAAMNASAQADQAQLDADNAASAARVQADRIRKTARSQAGEANAALAASGVEVGEGTALNINQEIYGNAEEDAVMTILNGENQRKRGYVDASNMALYGQQQRGAANAQAIGNVLQAGASYGMWKASAAGRNGTASKAGGAD
ncbi:hypothetical protein [Pseudomonas xantholysinigenes]|uniref:Uncharacterized protein n=1 Tax=Pseudomonas xantholysinigenes TaxID=2745490 RepID=A0A9E6Q077_9PSED|nr:hypothetical protein [Pseudomonas xantholysinigenes]QXI40438.1 hypothetical protein HU772_010340 [Pseudomonas xantholysinigenes]